MDEQDNYVAVVGIVLRSWFLPGLRVLCTMESHWGRGKRSRQPLHASLDPWRADAALEYPKLDTKMWRQKNGPLWL